MHRSATNLDFSESDELILRRREEQNPEFDITAMVDLVFMMNIYFLVTFVTVAMGELTLPAADHASPLDADKAVILSLVRSLDGESVVVYVGDGQKGEALSDSTQQEQRIVAAIDEGVADGKTAVLLKAETKVRLADMFRIASLISGRDLTLHVAVLERESK
jgi:biopolymer transport protein ExbD